MGNRIRSQEDVRLHLSPPAEIPPGSHPTSASLQLHQARENWSTPFGEIVERRRHCNSMTRLWLDPPSSNCIHFIQHSQRRGTGVREGTVIRSPDIEFDSEKVISYPLEEVCVREGKRK